MSAQPMSWPHAVGDQIPLTDPSQARRRIGRVAARQDVDGITTTALSKRPLGQAS